MQKLKKKEMGRLKRGKQLHADRPVGMLEIVAKYQNATIVHISYIDP